METEYSILRESKHPIIILPDSKPVQDAINLIKKGKFSASSRTNRFLTNINKIPINVKHLSGKYDLNSISDHQSRHLSECTAQSCSIHKFINELTETVLDPATKSAAAKPDSSFNWAAWIAAQDRSDSCRSAKHHLITGKDLLQKLGDLNYEIRFQIKTASIAPNGLQVAQVDSDILIPREPEKR